MTPGPIRDGDETGGNQIMKQIDFIRPTCLTIPRCNCEVVGTEAAMLVMLVPSPRPND